MAKPASATALLKAFAAQLGRGMPMLWGACEALATPRPLGPLEDIAREVGGPLAAALAGTDRHLAFVAFVDLLTARHAVAVIEDAHWADAATLDLLRHVGRRMARTRSLLVVSYRSDEAGPQHPLRAVLGDLASSGVVRLAPMPLSIDAVHRLCAAAAAAAPGGSTPMRDPAALHAETGGNPFFVTEVLAGAGPLPPTVQDAVLARAGRLSPAARATLDMAAVAGPRVEPGLLARLVGHDIGAIEECLACGVLAVDGAHCVFRHELARQAVLQSLSPVAAAALHARVLAALLADPLAQEMPGRLALHAEGAGNVAALRHWAPLAAHAAARRGAHREAAAHWARALRHLQQPATRAAALDAYAVEVHMSSGVAPALAAREEAARLWLRAGASDRAAFTLAECALLHMLQGRDDAARAALAEARALAVEAGPRAVARVQAVDAWSHVQTHGDARGLAAAARAAAEPLGDEATVLLALKAEGAAAMQTGDTDTGLECLKRALALAERRGDEPVAAQIMSAIGRGCAQAFRLDEAEAQLRQAIAYCADRDLEAPRMHLQSTLALVRLQRADWQGAERLAQDVLDDACATAVSSVAALTILGRLRARRGEPGAQALLDEALARATAAAMRAAPLRARAEAAWLEGRDADAAREAQEALALGVHTLHPAPLADLVLHARLGGAEIEVPAAAAGQPAALEAAGAWREAAAAWQALGCPYEAARALAGGDDAARREALARLDALGARALAERLRHRLRAAGVTRLPRGPRAATRAGPCGLTEREAAVLALLATGLRNKEIAARLHRSVRTVDHQLQAVYAKLGVTTRAEAVSAAHRLGLVTPDQACGPL